MPAKGPLAELTYPSMKVPPEWKQPTRETLYAYGEGVGGRGVFVHGRRVRVAVAIGVFVGVRLGVGVKVGVNVWVGVGVFVGVSVGVGVHVGGKPGRVAVGGIGGLSGFIAICGLIKTTE
jgi:hypothetical protein